MNSGPRAKNCLFTHAIIAAWLLLFQAFVWPQAATAGQTRPREELTFNKAVDKFVDAALKVPPPPLFTPAGLGGGVIHSPSISPYNENFLLAAGNTGGVYRSIDGGASWTLINMNQRPGNDFTGGKAARRVPQKRLRQLHLGPGPAFTPARVYWVSDLQYLCYSEDQGLSWNLAPQTPWNKAFEDKGGTNFIISVAVVPGQKPQDDHLLVSTTQGVWHGRDGGWKQLSAKPGGPVASAGNMLLAAVSADELAISLDRGAIWRRGIRLPGKIAALAAAYNSGGSLFLASVKGKGIYRSTDFGQSWKPGKKTFENETTLAIRPGQTKIAYALQTGSVKARHLLRTTDGGLNWHPLFYMPDSGQHGSTDYNVLPSWAQLSLGLDYYFTRNGFGLSASNPHFMLAATPGGLYATRDGGATWKPVTDKQPPIEPDGLARRQNIGLNPSAAWGWHFDPHDPAREYITYTGAGLARSQDNGKTWIWSADGSPWIRMKGRTGTFYDLAFDPDKPGLVYAAVSSEGGIPHYGSLARNHASGGNRGGVAASADHGASWKTPYKPGSRSGLPDLPCTGIVLDPSSPADKRILYASVFGADKKAGVYVSRDGGKSWNQTASQPGKLPNRHVYRLRLHPATGNLYCLVTGLRGSGKDFFSPGGGGLWMSKDQGKNWTRLTTDEPVNRWATSFAFDPADEQSLYVTAAAPLGSKSGGGVFKTADNGKTWVRLLSDAQTRTLTGAYAYDHYMAVAVHPDNRKLVFAGSALNGLFVSRDGGSSWRWCREFPFSSVQSIAFDPRDSDRILITTFGAGAWTASVKAVAALR